MDKKYMRLAIQEAKKGQGQTFTNPLVGAVIVKDARVLAKGAHLAYGQNHAERNAIKWCQSSEELFHSTMYVTLEPCNHFGKQPPCAQLIVDSGIKKVVVGQLDPNPLVAGQGCAFLEKNGVEVVVGVAMEEVCALNTFYNFFYENQRPYVALKQALTLDGRVALSRQQQTMITGQETWQQVRKERGDYQAILVGSQTVLADNPTLLTFHANKFPPIRLVLDRRGRVFEQEDLHLFQDTTAQVWVFTEKAQSRQLPKHVEQIYLPEVTIAHVLAELTKRKIQSIYVEGGPTIHDAFLASGLWDELITYLSPKVIGGNSPVSFGSQRRASQITPLSEVTCEKYGEDFRIRGRRKSECLLD